jgi:hypothetical protein
MKNLANLGLTVSIACLTVVGWATDEPRTLFGEVADSQCALNVHSLTRSHQEMLKSKSMGGTSASCALYCVRYLGGEFVLTSQKKVYRLDEQEAAAKFAGQRVKITGVLSPKSDAIHVVSIEADERPTSAR